MSSQILLEIREWREFGRCFAVILIPMSSVSVFVVCIAQQRDNIEQ